MPNQGLYQKAIEVFVAELLTVRKEKMSISYFLHEDVLLCLVSLKGFLPSLLSKDDSSIQRTSVIMHLLDDSTNKIRNVYDIVGLKQSGKTTLVRKVYPHRPYVSLEDPGVRMLASSDDGKL